jgi:WS/DGAT/MGAT family acyltransferase
MEQLSGLDAAFVHQESHRTPMHVTAVLIYDIGQDAGAAISHDFLLETLATRLQHAPVFRRKLQQVPMGLDTPYWVEVARPNWPAHVSEETLPAGTDWRGFHQLLSKLHKTPLRLKRPLWEMRLVHGLNNLPGLKIHHAAIDGMSMAAIIDGLHVETTGETQQVGGRPGPPSEWDLWTRVNTNFAGRQIKLVHTLRNLLPGLARARETGKEFSDLPPLHRAASPFNKRVNASRNTGSALFLRSEVLAIKRAVRRVTLNDIALACVGGALRRYLSARGQLARDSLACGAPINLRGASDKNTGGNKIATMVVGLATHIADPVERLRMIHRYAVAGKKQINALGTGTVMDISDSLTPGVLAEGIKTLARASHFGGVPVPFHTMVSNVPGPPVPMYLGRAKLVVPLGLGPVRDNLGLFHIVSSGDQMISISFSACAKLLPDAPAYEVCLRESFRKLYESAVRAN